MTFSRNAAVKLNFILNEVVPPIVRDSKVFMYFPMKFLLKDKKDIFMNFRSKAYEMSENEYTQAYVETEKVNLLNTTDLNRECIDEIVATVKGEKVLEAGCGRGYLTNLLRTSNKVTATDIFETKDLQELRDVNFHLAKVEELPFEDKSFDTVICTHVIEHVRDVPKAIAELRRVSKKRLIIVVPRERPYKYGFNLHLSFFPYEYSVINAFRPESKNVEYSCRKLGGDWYYVEEKIAE